MDAFKGKFERISAENYEEILKVRFCTYKHLLDFTHQFPCQALEVNFLLRKAATASTPSLDITESGGEWSIKSSTTLKTVELKFKVTNAMQKNITWFKLPSLFAAGGEV